MVARIKKNDTVLVLSGKDKGKQGAVIKSAPKKGLILVKDVAIMTRHVKAKRAGEVGGIKKEEAYINAAKVMPICTACNKPTRVNVKMLETGKRARMCNRCKEIF